MLNAGVGKEMAADYDHRSCLPSGAKDVHFGDNLFPFLQNLLVEYIDKNWIFTATKTGTI